MTPKIPSSNSTSATPMNRQIAARPTLLGFVQNFSIKTKLILQRSISLRNFLNLLKILIIII